MTQILQYFDISFTIKIINLTNVETYYLFGIKFEWMHPYLTMYTQVAENYFFRIKL